MMKWNVILALLLSVFFWGFSQADTEEDEDTVGARFKITGKISVPMANDKSWMSEIRILLDGGQYTGFIKDDGSFSVGNLPSGSYAVEVMHPTYAFEPLRVDITGSGKIRARQLNNIQVSQVTSRNYPLRVKAMGMRSYFMKREQLRLTDMLMNPMVLMMLMPMVFIFLMPKLMSAQDPETQREMEQMNPLNQDMSLGGLWKQLTGEPEPKPKKKKKKE